MKNKDSGLKKMIGEYRRFKVEEIRGRYLTSEHLIPILKYLKATFEVKEIGQSTEGIPIHTIGFGQGPIKILAWSQMHGNESTTTKAVLDTLQAINLFPNDPLIELIRQKVTLKIIPMLNPDGALRYTRENANGIDLNRDALNLREIESKLLRKTFLEFDPDFCLNLHDQRTIFSAGAASFPATLSFLTPAMDEKRGIFPERIISMQVIAAIAADLSAWLPQQIGRYSDEFNPNCTGDTFQSLGKPTILFEAGHYPGDYQRETTRKYVTAAFLSALINIATGAWKDQDYKKYLEIPENKKLFYDVVLREARVNGEVMDVAIQYKEVLENDEIIFKPYFEKFARSLESYGHKEIACENNSLTLENGESPSENDIVNNVYLNNEVLAINYQII